MIRHITDNLYILLVFMMRLINNKLGWGKFMYEKYQPLFCRSDKERRYGIFLKKILSDFEQKT